MHVVRMGLGMFKTAADTRNRLIGILIPHTPDRNVSTGFFEVSCGANAIGDALVKRDRAWIGGAGVGRAMVQAVETSPDRSILPLPGCPKNQPADEFTAQADPPHGGVSQNRFRQCQNGWVVGVCRKTYGLMTSRQASLGKENEM